MGEDRLYGLDTLRGFAALAVVFAHVYFFGGLPTPDLQSHAFVATIAVELFFILSAFSLCVAYTGKMQSLEDVREFYKRRAFRIAPLFYVMLVLWSLILGPGTAVLAANVTFTFGLIPGMHQSVVPAGWSLGTEVLFYAIFPLLLATIRGWKGALVALVLTTAFAATLSDWLDATIPDSLAGGPTTFAHSTVLTRLPFFVAGIAAYHAFRALRDTSARTRKLLSASLWIGCLLYFMALVVFADDLPDPQQFFFRYLVSAAFLPVVLAAALYSPRWFVNPVFVWLGTISYGIYLIHPLVLFLTRPFRTETFTVEQVGSVWGSFVFSFGTVALAAIVLASVAYLAIERPFQRFARRRSSKLGDSKTLKPQSA